MEFQAFPGDYHGRAFQGLESRFMKLQYMYIPGFPGCRQTLPLKQCWEGVTGLSPMEGGAFRGDWVMDPHVRRTFLNSRVADNPALYIVMLIIRKILSY